MIGDRIKLLRKLLNYSRVKVEALSSSNIKGSALTSIENNVSNISMQATIKIVEFYRAHGVSCDYEWLLTGIGPTPHIRSSDVDTNMNSVHESNFFRTSNPEAIVVTIDNNLMSPILNSGDLVGGVPIKSVSNQSPELCLITSTQGIIARLTQQSKTSDHVIAATYHSNILELIDLQNISHFYKIIWWRSFI